MRLHHQIFLGFFCLVLASGFFMLRNTHQEFRPAVRQASEEILIENAYLIAELIASQSSKTHLETDFLEKALPHLRSRVFSAQIWDHTKTRLQMSLYVTDAKGIVRYHSNRPEEIGKDYSQWNDVYLTLRGKYGARSTQENPKDNNSSVMHIAAPIRVEGDIIGSVTLRQPTWTTHPYQLLAQQKISQYGGILLLIALSASWLLAQLIARNINRLTRYADRLGQGDKAPPPKFLDPDFQRLCTSMTEMRQKLEDRQYVETYITNLTHELKSPLSAIQAASEILASDIPKSDQQQFLATIANQSQRITSLIARLLELSKLEKAQQLDTVSLVNLHDLITEIFAENQAKAALKNITLENKLAKGCSCFGDRFLLKQALTNYLDNAIDFSPAGQAVTFEAQPYANPRYLDLSCTDQGDGVPDFAKGQAFLQFFSLPRPDGRPKSSGLGLNFVQEIAKLHHGKAMLVNRDTGCQARLILPLFDFTQTSQSLQTAPE